MKKTIAILFLSLLMASFVCAETYNIGKYEVLEKEEYSTVLIQNGDLVEEDEMPFEPVGRMTIPLDRDKAVKDIRILNARNPEKLDLNLPILKFVDEENYQLVDNDCFEDKREPYLYTTILDGADYKVIVDIYPLEIVDCSEGKYILYKDIDLEVEYHEENNILDASYSEIVPGKPVKIDIEFQDVAEGDKVTIETYEGKEVEKQVTSGKMSFEVDAPENVAQNFFLIKYYRDYEVIDREIIIQETDWGSFDFRILVSENRNILPIAIEVNNELEEEIELDILIESVDVDSITQTSKKTTLNSRPGKQIHYINFEVGDDELINDIDITATYNTVSHNQGHNSIMRFTHDEVKEGLPSPREDLAEELSNIIESEESKPKTNISNILGIIIAVLLFGGVGFLAFYFLRKKRY